MNVFFIQIHQMLEYYKHQQLKMYIQIIYYLNLLLIQILNDMKSNFDYSNRFKQSNTKTTSTFSQSKLGSFDKENAQKINQKSQSKNNVNQPKFTSNINKINQIFEKKEIRQEPIVFIKNQPPKKITMMQSKEIKKSTRPETSKMGNTFRQPFVVNQNLEACKQCGRSFNEKALAKHQKICKKVFFQKRKEFNSAKQRIISKQQVIIMKKKNQNQPRQIKEQPIKGQMPLWKQQSLEFRMAMRQAKGMQVSQQENMLLKQQRENNSNMKQCKYCNRKFNLTAAQKHIVFCERKSKQMTQMNQPKKPITSSNNYGRR